MRGFLRKVIVDWFRAILILLVVYSVAYMTPVLKREYFRNSIGQYVVKIMAKNKAGQAWTGTGFHLRLPSGKVAILTNRHVCDGADGGVVYVQVNGIPHTRKVIEMSKGHDLCLVEPVLDKGASLAGSYGAGEAVVTLGHPSGYPLTMTEGEIVGYEVLQFFEPYRGKDTCHWGNQKVQTVDVPIEIAQHLVRYPIPRYGMLGRTMKVKACITTEKSVTTTAQIKTGSSGSPVFDIFGHVVGIQHATDPQDNWGRMVALENIKIFIKRR